MLFRNYPLEATKEICKSGISGEEVWVERRQFPLCTLLLNCVPYAYMTKYKF